MRTSNFDDENKEPTRTAIEIYSRSTIINCLSAYCRAHSEPLVLNLERRRFIYPFQIREWKLSWYTVNITRVIEASVLLEGM
jgi:hypothetical protein